MDSEDDAKDTLLDLRLKKRQFRGQSVKGRLKSETVVRSFYPVQAAPSMAPAIYPGMQMQYAGFVPGPMPIDLRYGYNMSGMIQNGNNMNNNLNNLNNNMLLPLPPSSLEMPLSSQSHLQTQSQNSTQDDNDTKTGSPSQNKQSRIVYPPVIVPGPGNLPQSGSGTGSSSASSYKGAATANVSGSGSGSGSVTGSGTAPREGATRDRSVKVTYFILLFLLPFILIVFRSHLAS